MKLGRDVERKVEVELGSGTREHGVYIIGRRRMGKSKLMEAMIAEDLDEGNGLAVFDPHGPLVDVVLDRIPAHREDDVVLLDIGDDEHPFGLNLFAPPASHAPKDVSRAVDQVVQAFKKIWGVGEDASWGPLLEDLLRNITHLLVANPGMTMTEVPDLLYSTRFRERLLANVPSRYVRQFWRYDYPAGIANSRDQREARRSTINKVRSFLSNPVLENIVGQATTVDFRAVMEERKILLVRLDLDDAGETTVALLGSMLIGQLLAAALSREPTPSTPLFLLYADEFQHFATPSFATLIDETGKYRIAPVIAHQRRSQLEWAYRDSALGSTNFVMFQLVGSDAEELVDVFEIEPQPGEPRQQQVLEPVYRTWTEQYWEPPEAEAALVAVEAELDAKVSWHNLLIRGLRGLSADKSLGEMLSTPAYHRLFDPYWLKERFLWDWVLPPYQYQERATLDWVEVKNQDYGGKMPSVTLFERFAYGGTVGTGWSLEKEREETLKDAAWRRSHPPNRSRSDGEIAAYFRVREAMWRFFSDRVVHETVMVRLAGDYPSERYDEAVTWLWQGLQSMVGKQEVARLREREAQLKACHKTRERQEQIGIRAAKEVVGLDGWGKPIEEARYEYVPGPLRPIADIRNELANRLGTLGARQAAVRLRVGNDFIQGIIEIPDVVSPRHDAGKVARIREQSRRRYARPRVEVERQLDERHRWVDETFGHDGPDDDRGAPPSRKPPRPDSGGPGVTADAARPTRSRRRRAELPPIPD